MFILGIILVVCGYFFGISILYTVGAILLIVGLVLMLMGGFGSRPVGGRNWWF